MILVYEIACYQPYPKSFMSLVQMKDYTYMVISDGKLL